MNLEEFKLSQAYKYAEDVINEKFKTNRYIKKICEKFIWEVDNQDQIDFFFDLKMAKKIMSLMKLIRFATGAVAGKSLYQACVGYQYFLVLNVFCWKEKNNPTKRRYETVILWIARKNSKSVNAGLFMILLMLLEPKYSEFYLCANTREQAKIVYNETRKLIECSPHIKKHFNIKRDVITCKLNENTLKALSSDFNTTDGLRVSGACIDEVGASKDGGLIESMASGMLSVENRLLILISTSYPNTVNPFLEWTNYAKRVIDGVTEDSKLFAMLYSLDEKDEFTVDNFLKANPLQAILPQGREYLESEYKKALDMGGAKLTSFKTKHLNLWLEGNIGEIFISTEKLKKGVLSDNDFSWRHRDVWLGLDLATTTDNCSVSMATYDSDGNIYVKSWAFIPSDKVNEKSIKEKVDYYRMIDEGYCFACGEEVVDYGFIEEFIMNLEAEYGVNIIAIGYDRFNCISTVNKLENEGYTCIEVRQHSSVLHPATKLIEESILNGKFKYNRNQLYEINFANCKVAYDTNLNKYVSKKKSNGKIDMVVSTIIATYLLNIEMIESLNDFVIQTI